MSEKQSSTMCFNVLHDPQSSGCKNLPSKDFGCTEFENQLQLIKIINSIQAKPMKSRLFTSVCEATEAENMYCILKLDGCHEKRY